MTDECVIDSAGAFIGGAARFMSELDRWLAETDVAAPTVLGRGRSLTSSWMVRREVLAPRRARRIALNNVGFLRPGGSRVVLLRNALHFADPDELAGLHFRPSPALRAQIPVVRHTAARVEEAIVPCSAMADRVLRYVPWLEGRLTVRPHPVTQRPWAAQEPTSAAVLVPIVNAPYKRLSWHLANILSALDLMQGSAVSEVRVTARRGELPPSIENDSRVVLLGTLTAEVLDQHYAEAAAVYFPTQLESFGYPLAEARTNGRRVVAIDTDQSREIAGSALAGFQLGDLDSLRAALDEAVTQRVAPDPVAFDPDRYFTSLVNHG